MLRIRRFGVVRTANTVSLVLAITYAIVFAIFAVVLAATSRGFAGAGAALLIGAVLALVFYAAVGWVIVAVGCALYNAVADRFGGIELRIDQPAPPTPSVPPTEWRSGT